jgi:hypothetical protein
VHENGRTVVTVRKPFVENNNNNIIIIIIIRGREKRLGEPNF